MPVQRLQFRSIHQQITPLAALVCGVVLGLTIPMVTGARLVPAQHPSLFGTLLALVAAGSCFLVLLTTRRLSEFQSHEGALQKAQHELRDQIEALQHENAERKRAEAAQARLTAILEATPDIVVSAEPEGSVIYLNHAGREILGVKPDEDPAQRKLLGFHADWAAEKLRQEAMPAAIKNGSWSGETAIINRIGQEINVSQVLIAHRDPQGQLLYFTSIVRDMTERRMADEALRDSQQRLVETSRLAGMAEVATGVLHNVGNVLNSVTVSAGLVAEKLRRSKTPNVARAAALLTKCNGDLAHYLTEDEKGRQLPEYLATLGEFLVAEHTELVGEMEQLTRNIEHIKEVVAMQQSYAKVSGVLEDLPVERLVEDALAMNIGAFERHGVVVQKRFDEVPLVRVDRHKVLQILINLIRNAKYALDDVHRIDKRITISIGSAEEEMVRVVVADNGVGIPAENLDRIFCHGFTTRKNGHGFGLHSGALAAQSLGGSLTAASLGVNRGATFTLLLPVAQPHELITTENTNDLQYGT